MCLKVIIFGCIFVLKFCGIVCQRVWVPPTTTRAEMWNIFTWLKPYAVAAAEGVRDFFGKAQEIQNQLYLQAYATKAFSWIPKLFGFQTPNKPEGGKPLVGVGHIPQGAKLPAYKPPTEGFPKPPVIDTQGTNRRITNHQDKKEFHL